MRGVLATESDARLLDVTHELPRQDVRAGAFWLREVLPYFPPATHLVVVDPGVGTDREVLVLEAGNHRFVGPDNGVMVPAAARIGEIEAWVLDETEAESSTFHGRDVFAPLAARVDGMKHGELDELESISSTDTYEQIEFPTPTAQGQEIDGEVLVIDSFGNIITNIPRSLLPEPGEKQIQVNGQMIPFVRSYAYVNSGDRLATIGSHGNLELAVNRARGEKIFELSPREPVTVRR